MGRLIENLLVLDCWSDRTWHFKMSPWALHNSKSGKERQTGPTCWAHPIHQPKNKTLISGDSKLISEWIPIEPLNHLLKTSVNPKIKMTTTVGLTQGQWAAACHALACSRWRSVAPWGRRCSDRLNGRPAWSRCRWTPAAPPRPWSGSPGPRRWRALWAWPSCGRHRQSGSPGPTAWTSPSDQPPQSSRLHEGLCPPSSPIPANCLHGYRGRGGEGGREGGRETQRGRERKQGEINFHFW